MPIFIQLGQCIPWCACKLLDRLKCESEVKQWKVKESGAHSLIHITLRGRGVCWSSGMRLGRMTSINYSHRPAQDQTISWLVHNLSIFGVRTSYKQTQIHKTHHGPDLGEATTFSLIVCSMLLHETHIQMAFCHGTPKWESQNSQRWDSCDFGGP
jgi:hypothetical protein